MSIVSLHIFSLFCSALSSYAVWLRTCCDNQHDQNRLKMAILKRKYRFGPILLFLFKPCAVVYSRDVTSASCGIWCRWAFCGANIDKLVVDILIFCSPEPQSVSNASKTALPVMDTQCFFDFINHLCIACSSEVGPVGIDIFGCACDRIHKKFVTLN